MRIRREPASSPWPRTARRGSGCSIAPSPWCSMAVDQRRGRPGSTPPGGGRLEVWGAATGKEVVAIDLRRRDPTSLALRPDGKIAALGFGDGTVAVWDYANLIEHAVLGSNGSAVQHVAFDRSRVRVMS